LNGAFSVLVEKSGDIFDTEGEPETVNALLPLNRNAANLFRLFPKEQQEFAGDLLAKASSNAEGRISDLTLVGLRGQRGRYNLIIQPAEPGKWWFRFTPAKDLPDREPSMIWVDFFDSVSYLAENSPEKPIELMMLSFTALADPELTGRIGQEGVAELRAAIEAKLSGRSLTGQVGRLDASSYAVVVDAGEDAQEIVEDVGEATQELGVGVSALGVRTLSVAMDAPAQGRDETRTALAHVRQSFLGDDDDDDFGGGTTSLSTVVDRIEITKTKILAALEAGDVTLAHYPVVTLADSSIGLHLVHGALVIDGEAVQASQRLILGDYPGLSLQHDLTIAREAVLEIVGTRKAGGTPVPVIIDINASSLAAEEFAATLEKILEVAGVAPGEIGFRVLSLDMAKQSLPSFQSLLLLLKRGHRAWLTRFASAVTGATLEGAFVEVAVTYLERLCDNPEGKALVTQLLQVWRNAGVQLVAVDVQSPTQRRFVMDLGIEYAIGPAAVA
jgi:EAL domain-containing protein (putative c-di-GMP-specific phosphodiesterase class I)